MRKKFTMLLASLFLCLGSAWAESAVITNLARLTDDLSCTVSTASRGGWAVNEAGDAFGSTNGGSVDPTNDQHLFQFKKKDGNYYLYSVYAEKYVNNDKTLSVEATQAIEFLPQDGGTFVIKFDNDHYVNINNEKDVVINGWGANAGNEYDAGNKVTITAVSVDPKTKLSWLVDDVQASYLYGKMPLQTTNATGAYYLSATVQGDAPIDKAIDNDPSTFYGSTWGAEVGSHHYWQVDLGEGVTLSSFVFSYVTRANGKDTPTKINVKGSMDGTEFAEIVSLTKDADGLPTAGGASYTSEEIASTNNYRYIRFEVPSTTTNFSQPGKPEQEVTIAIAEFSLYDIHNEDSYSDEDKAMQVALAAAKGLLAASNVTDKQYEDAYTAIKMAPVKKPVYPFTVTTDDAAPVLYAIKSGRDNEGKEWWYSYDGTDGKISLDQYSGVDTQFWFFKEVITDDYAYALQLLPYADKTKLMSYENTDNGTAKIVAKEDGSEGWTNLWLLASTNGEAPYGLQTYNKANYLSNNGGYKNKMGMWTGTPSGDPGTAMYIYTPAEVLQSLIGKAESMVETTDVVGYLTSAGATSLKSAIDKAKAQLVNKDYTVTELNAAIAGAEIVLPQAGKYYQLISGVQAFPEKKAIYSNGTAPAWKSLDGTDKSFYWTIVPDADGKSYTFCNVQDGMYLNGTAMALVDTAKTTAVTQLKLLVVGEFNIVTNGVTMHAYGHGSGEGKEGTIINYATGAGDASSWKIVEVDHPDLAMVKAALEQRIAELNVIVNSTGTAIGEYKEAEAAKLVAPLATAQAVLDGGSAVPSVYTEALKKLNETVSAFDLTLILPEAGKFYQIISGLQAFPDTMAIYSNGTAPAWKKLDKDSKSFYWSITPKDDMTFTIKNLGDNRYLNGTAMVEGAEAETELVWVAAGEFNLLSGGDVSKKLHAKGHGSGAGTSGDIIEYHEGDANSASSWKIVEVEPVFFYAVTYEYQYNGKTVATQVVSIKEGAALPELNYLAPYGVKVVGVKPEGKVTADVTYQIAVEVEKALPFKAAADVASINTWYYAQMHANSAVTSYIQDNEAGNVEWADRFVAEDEIDSHLWGFAGDVWTGIKVVNKATGKAIVSTKGDAAMGDAANATAFIPTNSQANGNWFCLKYPEANYLNAQSGKVASYGANDNGSSFLLTEYKEGAVEVSDIEYATLYLDYAAYIPEGVEVYVVEKAANGYATLKLVENDANAIPANTGVILKNAGKYTLKAAGAGSVANTSSLLKGSVADTYVAGGAYVLAEGSKGVGLYKAQLNKNEAGAAGETHFLNNAGKAYLPASAVADASAPMFSFDRGEGTTDIIDVEPAMENVVIYDLTGRRVEKMEKGIYIVNGRKVYVK